MIGQAIEGQVTVLDGIAAITSKLVNLGRDMKKLKENIHAIQVGYETCGGMHLDKECPLIEEVKRVEEVKYGEFGRSFPKNSVNEARGMGHIDSYDKCTNKLLGVSFVYESLEIKKETKEEVASNELLVDGNPKPPTQEMDVKKKNEKS
ncbi:hypothetical protein Tco_0729910 [Tanacetum coccineum]|uniref:Zinc knuckle CX2CX4HX4C n=1 Tax=Tanacetum coccineum TaxID=301880 RepID=A0ABQ4YQ78_9ASTR